MSAPAPQKAIFSVEPYKGGEAVLPGFPELTTDPPARRTVL